MAKKAAAEKIEDAQVEQPVTPEVEAPAEAPVESAPKGKQIVLISLRERDNILADEDAPKAVKTLLEGGVEVRRSNGAERPESIPAILPMYYSRWALRLTLTAKQTETLGSWTDLDEVEVGEAKPRTSKSGGGMDEAEKAALIEAQDLIKAVDAMPAPEAVKAAGTDEVQAAMELVGKANAAARRASN